MSPAKSFRIALVGCGRISKNHFEAIDKIDGLELVAVCDTDPERAKQAGEERNVPYFTSYERMLAESKADVVTIATPSGLHPEQGVAAAKAGKHVVMEKPMAISLTGTTPLISSAMTPTMRTGSCSFCRASAAALSALGRPRPRQ